MPPKTATYSATSTSATVRASAIRAHAGKRGSEKAWGGMARSSNERERAVRARESCNPCYPEQPSNVSVGRSSRPSGCAGLQAGRPGARRPPGRAVQVRRPPGRPSRCAGLQAAPSRCAGLQAGRPGAPASRPAVQVRRPPGRAVQVRRPPGRLHLPEEVAGPTRLELATSGVTGRRSNQLNYDPAQVCLRERRRSTILSHSGRRCRRLAAGTNGGRYRI